MALCMALPPAAPAAAFCVSEIIEEKIRDPDPR